MADGGLPSPIRRKRRKSDEFGVTSTLSQIGHLVDRGHLATGGNQMLNQPRQEGMTPLERKTPETKLPQPERYEDFPMYNGNMNETPDRYGGELEQQILGQIQYHFCAKSVLWQMLGSAMAGSMDSRQFVSQSSCRTEYHFDSCLTEIGLVVVFHHCYAFLCMQTRHLLTCWCTSTLPRSWVGDEHGASSRLWTMPELQTLRYGRYAAALRTRPSLRCGLPHQAMVVGSAAPKPQNTPEHTRH